VAVNVGGSVSEGSVLAATTSAGNAFIALAAR